MCWCNPNIRTPCCGGISCHPKEELFRVDEIPSHSNQYKETRLDVLQQEAEAKCLRIMQEDAKRYQWLKQHVTEVLCEGRVTECYSKWMLPRLTCEDSTGRRYTFDEIIDIQMKRELSNE